MEFIGVSVLLRLKERADRGELALLGLEEAAKRFVISGVFLVDPYGFLVLNVWFSL